jgi:hypothetical protein
VEFSLPGVDHLEPAVGRAAGITAGGVPVMIEDLLGGQQRESVSV